jgi:uncharacterized protein (TIGR02300 family)
VAKPELGIKRLCAGCGAKFYDLNKDPIVCPKCSTVFELAHTARARPEAVARAPVAAEEEVAAPEMAEAEFVSLEEADKETEGAKPVAAEGSDDEVEDEPLEDDGAFIVPEEEDEEDVTDIIGEGREDDEET